MAVDTPMPRSEIATQLTAENRSFDMRSHDLPVLRRGRRRSDDDHPLAAPSADEGRRRTHRHGGVPVRRIRMDAAAYAGLSVPVLGLGLLLQHLSPRVTLLIFAVAVALGIVAAAPVLVRPLDANPSLRNSP